MIRMTCTCQCLPIIKMLTDVIFDDNVSLIELHCANKVAHYAPMFVLACEALGCHLFICATEAPSYPRECKAVAQKRKLLAKLEKLAKR